MTTGMTNRLTDEDPNEALCDANAVETTPASTHREMPPDAGANPHAVGDDIEMGEQEDANAGSWRGEVAARLERYRTRRKPRTPRYPSLLLPFDAPESWSRPSVTRASGAATAPALPENDFELQSNEASEQVAHSDLASLRDAAQEESSDLRLQPVSHHDLAQAPSLYGNVIEFPRSAAIPVSHSSDLADPILDPDRPRIVEAPEILPPPPALGGILIEAAQQDRDDQPARIKSQSAPRARRALGAVVDGAIISTALSTFIAVLLRLNPGLSSGLRPMLRPAMNSVPGLLPLFAVAFTGIAVALWAAYQFLFVVYSGSTPGLRAAHLRISTSDGSPVNRRRRRWRVLASLLSVLSLGLGYVWCFLDQDGLCWHDRISRTQIQSATEE